MQKNWYAVITADILYDKQLTPRQKLLCAAIANMSNDKGYCFATNAHFSEMLCCSVSSIQRDLKYLEDNNKIGRIIKLNSAGEVEYRALTPTPPVTPPIAPVTPPHSTSDMTPHSTSDTYNNKLYNNKTNTLTESEFLELWKAKRKKHLNKPTNIPKLSPRELTRLTELKKDYTPTDIKNAMEALFRQEVLNFSSMTLRPQHFLDKFEIYFSAYSERNTTLYGSKPVKPLL